MTFTRRNVLPARAGRGPIAATRFDRGVVAGDRGTTGIVPDTCSFGGRILDEGNRTGPYTDLDGTVAQRAGTRGGEPRSTLGAVWEWAPGKVEVYQRPPGAA